MDDTIIYDQNILREFSENAFFKTGLSYEDSKIITDTLIFADLRNITSHGVTRLPVYINKIINKVVDINSDMNFVIDEGAVSLLDANNGLGQLASYKAMKKSISIASEYGIGMTIVRDSNHFGVASFYSMMSLEKGMIGVVMTNASPAIAPYGAKQPLFGTNPLSIAIPAKDKVPIVLDMAMSTVARGKIRIYDSLNKEIPADWGLDSNGKPTTDPKEALKGSLVPIGGVKGSALSLIIDILCGVLSDTSLPGGVKNINDMSGPSKTSHIFISLDISKFLPIDIFGRNIDISTEIIKNLEPLGDNLIYMPGEIEYNTMIERMKEGIPVNYNTLNKLNDLADSIGINRI